MQIDALSNLKLVGTALTIKDNNALTSIQGLSGLIARTAVTVSGTASAGELDFTGNTTGVCPVRLLNLRITADAEAAFRDGGPWAKGYAAWLHGDGATYATGEIDFELHGARKLHDHSDLHRDGVSGSGRIDHAIFVEC